MYLERKCIDKKYTYRVKCSSCNEERWVANSQANRCKPCAGKETYNPPTIERHDKLNHGDGYITKQGYHLVYLDGKYTPAHRVHFPDITPNEVVHHIDGDKLNNELDNLLKCSRQTHREIHGQLERLSYYLIQNRLIYFEDGKYIFSTAMKKFIDENSVNSGKPLSITIEGNPEPIPFRGRCNDYPFQEYVQVDGSAEHPEG